MVSHRTSLLFGLLLGTTCLSTNAAFGGTVFRSMFLGSEFIWRWDAAHRVHQVDGQTIERSLQGGLRYSLEGGSFSTALAQLSWQGNVPTLGEFTQAVRDAFATWTTADPVSGLPSALSFTEDLTTAVSSDAPQNVNLGSEIDIFFDDFGDPVTRGFASVWALGEQVQLTSGVVDYPSFAISGSDIFINSNVGARYTLEGFQLLLTHELGHALGLADLEVADTAAVFIDDDYDDTSSLTALNTLTNSWARRVNTSDPDDLAGTGLSLFQVANGDPGIATAGVNILMESVGSIELIGEANPMRNDDYGTRQFLYPVVVPPTPDFNLDTMVDCDDIDALVTEIVAGTNDLLFDLTGDGQVNEADLSEWLALAGAVNLPSGAPYIVGDADLDGDVDDGDFSIWNQHKFSSASAWCSGDFNADGLVNGHDFLLWNRHKFMSAAVAVPEPVTIPSVLGFLSCLLTLARSTLHAR